MIYQPLGNLVYISNINSGGATGQEQSWQRFFQASSLPGEQLAVQRMICYRLEQAQLTSGVFSLIACLQSQLVSTTVTAPVFRITHK